MLAKFPWIFKLLLFSPQRNSEYAMRYSKVLEPSWRTPNYLFLMLLLLSKGNFCLNLVFRLILSPSENFNTLIQLSLSLQRPSRTKRAILFLSEGDWNLGTHRSWLLWKAEKSRWYLFSGDRWKKSFLGLIFLERIHSWFLTLTLLKHLASVGSWDSCQPTVKTGTGSGLGLTLCVSAFSSCLTQSKAQSYGKRKG